MIETGLRLGDDLREPIMELGRLTYKSSGVCVYLPKDITNALHLDPEVDRNLVIYNLEDYWLFLIKDRALADMLKPDILELRKKALEFMNKLAKKE